MSQVFCRVLVLFFCFAQVCWATINGEFSPLESRDLREGDVFEGVFRFWPIENPDLAVFRQLKGQVFFNSFYLVDLIGIDVSENNAEVLEVKASFIVKASKVQPVHSLIVGSETVDLKWKGPDVEGLKEKRKEFYIENQAWTAQRVWIAFAMGCVVLVIILIIFRKHFRFLSASKKNKEAYTPQMFDEMFRAANSREEFERVYALKEHWTPLLKVKTSAHSDFFKIINQHQYKRHWGPDELNEIKSAFDSIRRSFTA